MTSNGHVGKETAFASLLRASIPNSSSPFLALPKEIRDLIYDECIKSCPALEQPISGIHNINVFLICTQISLEARERFRKIHHTDNRLSYWTQSSCSLGLCDFLTTPLQRDVQLRKMARKLDYQQNQMWFSRWSW
ncbi:hypothetical protein EJ08DRAFT_680499 [Tothia fuscella]|uniref:Uncharacterized protein n=1 Tax=Tothia fuscella TaxID=1048955 RepID=A0A9P4TX25_9PEZI|nr:hypothetical protein EJ08DRAFT_680499 [Tothia fuscella]